MHVWSNVVYGFRVNLHSLYTSAHTYYNYVYRTDGCDDKLMEVMSVRTWSSRKLCFILRSPWHGYLSQFNIEKLLIPFILSNVSNTSAGSQKMHATTNFISISYFSAKQIVLNENQMTHVI